MTDIYLFYFQKCWEHAGCSYFFVKDKCAPQCFDYDGIPLGYCYTECYDECSLVIGHVIDLGPNDGGFYGEERTFLGYLNQYCPANPFVGQFTKTSVFYCKFLTEVEAESLIDNILSINKEYNTARCFI